MIARWLFGCGVALCAQGSEIDAVLFEQFALIERPPTSETEPIVRVEVSRFGGATTPHTSSIRYRVASATPETADLAFHRAAIPNVDFAPVEGVLQFLESDTIRSIEIPLFNNSIPDGNRVLVAELLSEEGLPLNPPQTLPVIIVDDERVRLRQEVPIRTFNQGHLDFANSSPSRVFALRGNKSLIAFGSKLLRLGSDNLPDPTFGAKAGHVALRDGGAEISYPFFNKELPNGMVYFQYANTDANEMVFGRLLPDGALDETFGARGRFPVELSAFGSVIFYDDGRFLLQSIVSSRWMLRRYLADGSFDTTFTETNLPDTFKVQVAPDGSIYITDSGSLRKMHPDGSPDESFTPIESPAALAGFDAFGRAYVHLGGQSDRPIPEIIRFHQNGAVDASFRIASDLLPQETFLSSVESPLFVEPDGSLLGVWQNRISRFAQGLPPAFVHAGTFRGSIVGLNHRADGVLELTSWICGFPAWCYQFKTYLQPDGREVQSEIPNFTVLQEPSPSRWDWQGISNDDLERATPAPRAPVLWRTSPAVTEPAVGFLASGRFVSESNIQIPLQRAGSTASPASIRGEIRGYDYSGAGPVIGTFQADFPSNIGTATAQISGLFQPGPQPLREYALRITEATGAVISDMNACRLWVLDDERRAQRRALGIDVFPTWEEQGAALVTSSAPLTGGTMLEAKYGEESFRGAYLGLPDIFGNDWGAIIGTAGDPSVIIRANIITR